VGGRVLLTGILIAIAIVDWRTRRVPHWLSWSTLGAAVVYRSWQGCWVLALMAIGIVLLDLLPKKWRVAGAIVLILGATAAGLALGQEDILQISIWWAVAYAMWTIHVVGGADVRLFWTMVALFPNAVMALMLGLGLFVWAGVWVVVTERERTLAAIQEAGLRLKLGAFPTKEKLAAEGRPSAAGLVVGALAYVWLLA